MTDKPVRIPGPDHPISIIPHPGHVTVRAGGRTIAETDAALALSEASYPPVLYVPRADADMAALERSDHTTWCQYKGDASYFSIAGAGEGASDSGRNAVWTYETPHDAVAAIGGYLAFYTDRVEVAG